LVLASVLTDGKTILGVGSWIATTVLVWQPDLGRAREDTRGRPHYPARLDLRVGQHPPLRPFAAAAISPARLLKGYPTLDPGNIETAGAAESGDPGPNGAGYMARQRCAQHARALSVCAPRGLGRVGAATGDAATS
jgi:hypothetical protein